MRKMVRLLVVARLLMDGIQPLFLTILMYGYSIISQIGSQMCLQIFQCLASMPVELEGYIRPGCTILTVFVTMPKIMWKSLLEDPLYYLQDIVAPGKMLFERGTIFVHLNDMVFCVLKGPLMFYQFIF
ncbi:hypothetical protein K1719_035219 [Acacia pycnantha]|nr:hypothetical protein K1719_035219 [Acacia pycnantha]